MDNDYGLVSIITPNFNSVRYIRDTVESVIRQSYSNWEMLIQDDWSNDGSYELALELAKKDPRIKVERNDKNSGAAISRNNAIKRSKGEWIAFLDSDDLWLPYKLEKQLEWMVYHNCDFSFTEYEQINADGTPQMIRAKATSKLSYSKMLFHCWTGCLTVMFKQDLNNKIYGPDVKNNNDYALFLNVLKEKKNARGIHEVMAFYRIHKSGISRSKFHKIKPFLKVIHDIEGKNWMMSGMYLFTNQLIKYVYKYAKIKVSLIEKLRFS